MHLQGQYGRDNGGAIYANGNINITESVFKNNEADDDDGGAVYCTGNMYIFHTLFESNKAYVDGGAVFCEGKITAKYSRFAYNKASGAVQRCFGGAVRSEGACYIDSAYFSNNYAEDYGGAVYADDNIYISNDCLFTANKAENYGGSIYAEDNVYINWIFDDAKTAIIRYSNVETDGGGGIYAEDNVYINKAYFDTCFAKIDGGAIYCKGKSTLRNSLFEYNKVEY